MVMFARGFPVTAQGQLADNATRSFRGIGHVHAEIAGIAGYSNRFFFPADHMLSLNMNVAMHPAIQGHSIAKARQRKALQVILISPIIICSARSKSLKARRELSFAPVSKTCLCFSRLLRPPRQSSMTYWGYPSGSMGLPGT